jgi:hypothetical protein
MTKGILPSIRDAEFFDLLSKVLERLLQKPISGQLHPEYRLYLKLNPLGRLQKTFWLQLQWKTFVRPWESGGLI